MVDDVKLNAGDNRSEVALRIARAMWAKSKRADPGLEDANEFLAILQKCVYALK